MRGVRVVVGPNSNEEWSIHSEDGEDLTDKLQVKSVRIEAGPDTLTKVHLECYGEVEARGELHTRFVDGPQRSSLRVDNEFHDAARSVMV